MLVTRVTNAITSRPQMRASQLRVVDGPDRGIELDLPPIGVVIGTERTCDVVLTDGFVSRRHCSVAPHAQGFAITDLGSKNGTVIDGVAVGKVVAPPGVAIRIGKTLVQLMPADEVIDIPPSASERFGALYGGSHVMRQVFALLERASKSVAPILFLGESGTGKELMARGVHDASPRKDGPFVVFDCGASADTLIESVLFGHTRGAFTGAVKDRAGRFEQADTGTVLLDDLVLRLGLAERQLVLKTRAATGYDLHPQTIALVGLVGQEHLELLTCSRGQRDHGNVPFAGTASRMIARPLAKLSQCTYRAAISRRTWSAATRA